jgi:hypothetical protein
MISFSATLSKRAVAGLVEIREPTKEGGGFPHTYKHTPTMSCSNADDNNRMYKEPAPDCPTLTVTYGKSLAPAGYPL